MGTLGVSGNNTYIGATTIAQGTLKLEHPEAGLPANLQVMPMGDSITYEASPASGYRSYLYNLLGPVAPGFQFVGASTLSSGSLPTSPVDQTHHNGYPSYATLDLANNLDGLDTACYDHWGGVERNPNGGYWFTGEHGTGRAAVFPDVILLMVGTNDINQGGQANPEITVPNYQANLTYLINKIVTLRPDARLLVGKITPYPNQATTLTGNGSVTGASLIASTAMISPGNSNAALGSSLAWDTSSFTRDGSIKLVSVDPYAAWATQHGVSVDIMQNDDGWQKSGVGPGSKWYPPANLTVVICSCFASFTMNNPHGRFA